MTRITLQADSLITTLPTLLPAASPVLLSQQDAVAALLHTIHTTIAFELIAVNDLSATNVLPVGWNDRAPDFTLEYRHPESSATTLTIKVLKLSNRTLIHGSNQQVSTPCGVVEVQLMVLPFQSDADASFEFSTATYVSPSYFPSSIDSEPLIHAFVSAERLEEFVTEYLNKIVKVLTPDISLESSQSSERSLYPPILFYHHHLTLSLELPRGRKDVTTMTVRKPLRPTRRTRFSHRLQALVFVNQQDLSKQLTHTRSGVKTLTQFQTSTRSRLRLSSVAFSQVEGCTSAPIIRCLQDVVVVVAPVERGLGAVTGTCPRLVPRMALVLTQSVRSDVVASLAQGEGAVVHQARLEVIQTMTNSSLLVRGPLELLAEITRLS